MPHRALRRTFSLLVLPLVMAGLLLLTPQPASAASGGRIGGGSFRSSPSLPRSYGGGGYRGGYGGNYGGGYRGGFGGGFGFPFLVPVFGFGGGLFGFLVLMAVVGLLLNALRGGGGSRSLATGDGDDERGSVDGPVSIAQVQIGLLASARSVQEDLRRLAGSADTGSSAGLQQVLQETTLSLLRQPELWVYAAAEVGQVPFASAESTFNRLSMQERSKLRREITANVAGRRSSDSSAPAGSSGAASDYIAITVLVASRSRLNLAGAASADALRDSLQRLGAVASEQLLALEVIWQPEGAGEVLSSEELITAYPDLQHL
ncbi:MAG: DUF1517 domain-containing protein [Synechococcus sp.]|nr:DUF1517 domain-containing protein [Synechococcus sp.]